MATVTVNNPPRVQPSDRDTFYSTVVLPKSTLRQISGTQTDWVEFHDYLDAVVNQRTDLPPSQKFGYLKECCTDEPARLIKALKVGSYWYDHEHDHDHDSDHEQKFVRTAVRPFVRIHPERRTTFRTTFSCTV